MSDLEPITREEKLLDGEDLTPITRKEKFIKRIYDKTQEIPEPVTREEMFLKKAGEGSGGDVTIEQLDVSENGTYSESGKAYSPVVVTVPQTTLTTLNVAENGTYTAPSGTAYDEVNVNVPLPENAYLLEEYEDVPTDIASFTASDAPLKSLTASIVPVQAGSGDPSPTNVRPISGWTEEVITRTGKNLLPMNRGYNFPYNPNVGDTMDVTTATAGWTDEGNGDFSCTIANWERNGLLASIPKNQTISMSIYIKEGKPRLTTVFLDKDFKVVDKWGNANPVSEAGYYQVTTTQSEKVCYVGICIVGSDGNKITITNPTIQLGNTAITYEPYAGTTTTIPFTDSQGESVEVFGGSVDVVNGGEQPSTYVKWTVTPTANQITSFDLHSCMVQIPTEKVPNSYNVNINKCLCDKLKPSNYSAQYDNHIHFPNVSLLAFYLEDEVGTTKQDWVDYLAQAQITVCYKLATPTTFYTQPTSIKSLDGVNNVFASTGQIETLEYFTKEE